MAKEKHWSEEKEKGGGAWQLKLMLRLFKLFGPGVFRIFIAPVIFVFFMTSRRVRGYVREFQQKIDEKRNETTPRRLSPYRTFRAFGISLIDKLSSWGGLLDSRSLDIGEGDFDDLVARLKTGKGVVGICSHLGNTEMLRALGNMDVVGVDKLEIRPIVNFKGNPHFNAILEEVNGKSMEKIISTDEIGPDTIIEISDFIETGGMVVIAGDRTSATNQEKSFSVPFLDEEALLPMGVFVLVDILKVPVYHIFSVREDDLRKKSRYTFYVFRSEVSLEGKRSGRGERVEKLGKEFSSVLEKMVLKYPHQWFNFFRFWK